MLTTDEHGDVARGAVVVTVRVRHRALQVAVVDEQLEPEGLSRRERNGRRPELDFEQRRLVRDKWLQLVVRVERPIRKR